MSYKIENEKSVSGGLNSSNITKIEVLEFFNDHNPDGTLKTRCQICFAPLEYNGTSHNCINGFTYIYKPSGYWIIED